MCDATQSELQNPQYQKLLPRIKMRKGMWEVCNCVGSSDTDYPHWVFNRFARAHDWCYIMNSKLR